MEYTEVVRRRRMVRAYEQDRAVSRDVVAQLLALAVRAPSAGFSQGWHFLVLDDAPARAAYWTATTDAERAPDRWLQGMRTAPVLIVVLSHRAAYEVRYARADKQRGEGNEAVDLDARWTVPYWHLDAAMAALLVLLGAVDRSLAAAWFGIPPQNSDKLRETFDIPSDYWPVGAISLGYPQQGAPSAQSRRRRPMAEVVSYTRFGSPG